MDTRPPHLCILQSGPSPLGPSIILASIACPSPRLPFTSQANVMAPSIRTFKFPAHRVLEPGFLSTAVYLPAYVLNGHDPDSRIFTRSACHTRIRSGPPSSARVFACIDNHRQSVNAAPPTARRHSTYASRQTGIIILDALRAPAGCDQQHASLQEKTEQEPNAP